MRRSESERSSTGALELLEDDLVHPASGVDQRGGDDRQGAALLDVPRRTEETLRFVERVGIDAARQNLSGVGHDHVLGAGEAGDRVEQDHDVVLVLDQTLRLLDHHIGDLHVTVGGLVECRGDDLAVDVPLHVSDLLGPLVDQEHDELDLRMVLGDRVRHLLEEDGLAGLWRGDDQATLPLPDRREEIHDPHRHVAVRTLELDRRVGIERA
jgi:hypothetical protein